MNLFKNDSISYWKDKILDFFYIIESDFLYWVDYLRYRTTRRYHVVDTKLIPAYYDADTRILHANFSILVDFVEVEKAWMNTWCNNNKYNKLSWVEKKFMSFRSPEDGIEYLNWEIERCDNPSQSKSAKEILELYTWWKEIRPNRVDPFDLAGYNEVFKDENWRDRFTLSEDGCYVMKPLTQKQKAVFKKADKIEQQYDKEDETMLIRLMKIRKSLWT
jgi:hypothetical protein